MCQEKDFILWLLFFYEISPKEKKDSVLRITDNYLQSLDEVVHSEGIHLIQSCL